ncbi:MAG: ABC-F family ATP-binding cassette domain-containing protein [Pseudomonadota bacterium]|nr:ABC-F family ATP-binding cassette domain-containing protein [Pseudomonadota bacterium]
MIDINDITVRIGSKVLLDHASAHISDGQKVGLVGVNGCGKSTLFRVLRGQLDTESGNIALPSAARVVTVEQEINDIDLPILEFVLAQDKERDGLLKRLQNASAEELGEIHERLNAISASSAEARAAVILNGLGFKNSDFIRPVCEFSGGWRMRLALAAALFQPSDILLLDEPTNHLDLETSIWLENHLKKYRGTLLIISHDRTILNSLCGYIVHFDNKKLAVYSGNYDTFRRTRNEQKEMLERSFKKQEQKRRHLESFVERFRYKASKAKQAQSRIKLLEKMPEVTLLADDPFVKFDFPEPAELASPLVNLENVSAGYGDKVILKRLNLSIDNGDRIALLGANGNGKSTFAKLLSGRLQPLGGEMRRTPKLKVGYFAQHQAEELPLEKTAAEYMAALMPEADETKVRAHLARFGLEKEKALTRISLLSGGEKARLLFAAMTRNAPELLILDEPTNHLDMEARDALVEALNEYAGSVILITHDLHLIELVADDLWLVDKGSCRPYDGDLDDYKELLLSVRVSPEEKKAAAAAEKEKQQAKEAAAAARNNLKELKSRLRRIETELERQTALKTSLENKFQEQLSTDEIIRTQKELNAIVEKIEALETEWLEIGEQLGEI